MVIAPLLLIGSGVGLYFHEPQDMEPAAVERLEKGVLKALKARTQVSRVHAGEIDCTHQNACVGELFLRLGVQTVILVRAFGGARRVRVLTSRFQIAEVRPLELKTDLMSDGEWESRLDSLAASLIPVPVTPTTEVSRPADDVSEGIQVGVLTYVSYGVAIAAGGAAVGFGLSNRAAKSDLESELYDREGYRSLVNRMERDGAIANVLFGVAITALISGAVTLALGS